jgi:hypothetical protein
VIIPILAPADLPLHRFLETGDTPVIFGYLQLKQGEILLQLLVDALAATEMMGLLERTVAHMEKMNSYNKSNSEELLRLLREKEGINEKLKKDLALLQLQITEDHRRITGLEKTVEREIRWRKDGDDHYCLVVDCPNRLPPRGTFKRVEEQQ